MGAVRDLTDWEVALPVGANSVSSLIAFDEGNPLFIKDGTGGQGAIWWDNRAQDPYRGFYVSNNGLLSLGGPFTDKTPIQLDAVASSSVPIICPFWADIDTTLGGSVAYFQSANVEAQDGFGNNIDVYQTFPAYGATWRGVKSPGSSGSNTFQVVIIDRNLTGPGGVVGPTWPPYFDFDLEFNYDAVQWDNGGTVRVGFYTGVSAFEFPWSGVGGRMLDSNTADGLIWHSHDSRVAGRYRFRIRSNQAHSAIILGFGEGLQNDEQINAFYAGGTGGFGSTGGTNVGATFVNMAARRGETLDFGGGTVIAADGTMMSVITSATGIINIPAGFSNEFSTSFLVPDVAGATLRFFDQVDGGGALVKEVTVPQTGINWTGWRTLLVGLGDSTVRSITISGTANRVGIDTLRLGTFFSASEVVDPTPQNLVFPNDCEDRP